tara:strand:+ start:3190 stop:3444 length:255 start_codon:yes stop_codon:yes gene_type:complete
MTNTNKSTAINFAYSSVGFFAFSFFISIVSTTIGGLGLLGSCLLGVVAFVLGLIEKNAKAWGLGLIAPVLFFALTLIGLAMGIR